MTTRRSSNCAASRSASARRYDAAARATRSLSRRFGAAPTNEVVHAVDNVDLAVGTRRGRRPGRRIRLRQIHARPHGRRHHAASRRRRCCSRASDIATLPPRRGARCASSKVQMIFQDPYASLNPRLRVADIVGEAPLVHGLVDARRARRLSSMRSFAAPASIRRYKRRYPAPVLRRPARSASASPARSRCSPSSWCATRRWPRSTCRSRRRSSICSWTCARELDLTYLFISHDLGVVRASLRSRADHVSRPHRRERADRRSCSRSPTIPTPRRCSPRCRASTRASASFTRDQGRDPLARSRRRPAATSIRAARTRCRAAASKAPRAARDRARPPQRLPPERRIHPGRAVRTYGGHRMKRDAQLPIKAETWEMIQRLVGVRHHQPRFEPRPDRVGARLAEGLRDRVAPHLRRGPEEGEPVRDGPEGRRGRGSSSRAIPTSCRSTARTGQRSVRSRRRRRIYARGAADMKSFIAVVLAMTPRIRRRRLEAPIHFALTYDEEVGCIGVRGLIAATRPRAASSRGCIIGEPT